MTDPWDNGETTLKNSQLELKNGCPTRCSPSLGLPATWRQTLGSLGLWPSPWDSSQLEQRMSWNWRRNILLLVYLDIVTFLFPGILQQEWRTGVGLGIDWWALGILLLELMTTGWCLHRFQPLIFRRVYRVFIHNVKKSLVHYLHGFILDSTWRGFKF